MYLIFRRLRRRPRITFLATVALLSLGFGSVSFTTEIGRLLSPRSVDATVGQAYSAAAAAGGGPSSPVVEKLFPVRPLVLLSISYHATPVYDLVDQLEPLGVKFIERGINAYGCRYFNSCTDREPLKVIDPRSVHQYLGYGDVDEFHATYGDDPEWKSVDAFLCMHAAATCELFVPFNRTIIVLTTIRYDNGRLELADWRRWNDRLRRIAADPRNVVAANNRYDIEYIRYFTGIVPRLLPSRCSYTRAAYNPTRTGFLLGLRRDEKFTEFFLERWSEARRSLNLSVQLTPIRRLYPTYRWSDLASHRGIVPLPCQPSMMGILEQYRMNIPLFLPSKELVVKWELSGHPLLNEIYSHLPGDTLPPHSTQTRVPDPTTRNSSESIGYWTRLCDWYTILPHVVVYRSVEDLVVKMSALTLDQLLEISRLMAAHNRRFTDRIAVTWKEILSDIARNSPNEPH